MSYWTREEAVDFCRLVEQIAPQFGAHVALTGGTLYKDGPRKDVDIILYRIRQVERVDFAGLAFALASIGVIAAEDFGWCKKATWNGKAINFFDPDASGDYGADDPAAATIEPFLPPYVA